MHAGIVTVSCEIIFFYLFSVLGCKFSFQWLIHSFEVICNHVTERMRMVHTVEKISM